MNESQIRALLDKHKNGTLTTDETVLLESWYLHQAAASKQDISDKDLIRNLKTVASRLPLKYPDAASERLSSPLWRRIAVAAALTAATFGAWLYHSSVDRSQSGAKQDIVHSKPIAGEVKPGRNTATLTLANGKKIHLSDSKTGVIIDASRFSYSDGTTISTSLQYASRENLTISTPRGGTYQVILPDGSKVWLNAASTIQFPASFKGLSKREVKLIGEGYFEISKNESHPFTVQSGEQIVEVLGTHFNINSYTDEGTIKTTLLEGSVSVSLSAGSASLRGGDDRFAETILRPGQQSVTTGTGPIKVNDVNASEAVAWIDGKFVFNSTSFESAMNMIARWYNVDINYEYKPSTLSLGGSISRTRSLADLLKRIEQTGEVRFKIEGRRVTVIK